MSYIRILFKVKHPAVHSIRVRQACNDIELLPQDSNMRAQWVDMSATMHEKAE